MSEIRALKKLREQAEREPLALTYILNDLADEIQAEIDERFMELPVDADGVPIHVGEEMTCHGDVFTVCAAASAKIHRWVTVKLGETQTTYRYDPMECTHYNPRTLEDVLADVVTLCANTWKDGESPFAFYDVSDVMESGNIREYADEIRELMKEGGE